MKVHTHLNMSLAVRYEPFSAMSNATVFLLCFSLSLTRSDAGANEIIGYPPRLTEDDTHFSPRAPYQRAFSFSHSLVST